MKANKHKLTLTFCFFLISFFCVAQKKYAYVSGKVVDENEKPMSKVSVEILGREGGTITSDSGTFRIKTPAEKPFALIFTFLGYRTEQRNFYLSDNEQERITIKMEKGSSNVLEEVVVANQPDRNQTGLIKITNPKLALTIPSATGGVESLIKIFVGSNNELTSQYSVRGGNYDENLIYINDFEIFRPYLVRSGQQEGLSFINPELVKNINFYTGGFQAKYGDKTSSVLDIQYRKPKKIGGSAYVSLLEQGLQLEGASQNGNFTYVAGIRQRTNANLLGSQEVKGKYIPSSMDFQSYLTWQLNNKWSVEALGNISRTQFKLSPEFSQQTSSVFSPFFTANLGLDIYFDGREIDRYVTNMAGITAINQPHKNLRLKWMASRFQNNEKESIDIAGAYLFGERNFDRGNTDNGLITNPLGAGVFLNYARNRLNIEIYNLSHKGSFEKGKNFYQWGLSVEKQSITDRLNEWELQDSGGYTLPYNPEILNLSKVIKSKADLDIKRIQGYIQDNLLFKDTTHFTLQAGVRFNYNTLNKEFLLSPRLQASWKPLWKRDVVIKLSVGSYNQPPFYRELRRYDGTINTDVKSQKSWQAVVGFDYNFKGLGGRPSRLQIEAYYKYITHVVPYDIDNVRIRYFGENNAKAFTTGIEARLFGELVKDAESWISIGIMQSRENLNNDFWYNYKIDSLNNPIDSVKVEGGWLRRPTDRLITFGMFFQDYLSTNKNFKVHLNTLFGTNLPYNIPNSTKYRNALTIDPYIRIDLGFSFLLLNSEKANRRRYSPFKNFDNIWASLEVFNIIDRPNTISYLLIKDFANNIFTIPNRLTPRLVNFKIVARW
ncbi:MAG TPA: TonB-dependent receptor [Chitinophagaceae bacterium]|nr:TonB-dependent receptor [Chitinophagaceae bacterium]